MQKKCRKNIFKKTVIMGLMTITALGFSLFSTALANAGEAVVVIVSANNPVKALSVEQVHKFYENDIVNWSNGKKVVLYDLRTKDEARAKFSEAVLGKEPSKVAMEWANRKITNTAKNPPRTVRSAILMQERVAKDPNAIGYLLKSDVKSSKVKIVTTIE